MESEGRYPLRLDITPVPGIPVSPQPAAAGMLKLYWLGQAGFLADLHFGPEAKPFRFLIDPYLSDSLAEKYRGSRFPHIRMAAPPVRPEDLLGVDAVFCTHGHTDHLDPGTLPVIASNNTLCRFVIPKAASETAAGRGVPADRTVMIDAGEAIIVDGALEVKALASAHEELTVNDRGESLHLGYVIRMKGLSMYHSGDCVPYYGLSGILKQLAPDVFLLPVNGRDEKRRANGIPGNFHLEEALDLAGEAGARVFIGHHFGMFDFNTIDITSGRETLSGWLEKNRWTGLTEDRACLAALDVCYEFLWNLQ